MSSGALQRRESIHAFFASIAHRYDLANHLLSGGCDFLWRRMAAQQVKDWQPARVLDLATGSGDIALAVKRACGGSLIVGGDFCRPMLLKAQGKGQPHLIECDALQLPFSDGSF